MMKNIQIMQTMQKIMQKLVAILAVLTVTLGTSACNTIKGFGRDVERGGEKVQGAATDVQKGGAQKGQ